MHFHVRIHHWVVWWFYVGVVCGAVAIVNILWRDLSPTQIKAVLFIGALFWVLGGLACCACDGVKIAAPPKPAENAVKPPATPPEEWHSASDFVLPGNRKSLLPPKYR